VTQIRNTVRRVCIATTTFRPACVNAAVNRPTHALPAELSCLLPDVSEKTGELRLSLIHKRNSLMNLPAWCAGCSVQTLPARLEP
jgi:hypothetical protein